MTEATEHVLSAESSLQHKFWLQPLSSDSVIWGWCLRICISNPSQGMLTQASPQPSLYMDFCPY